MLLVKYKKPRQVRGFLKWKSDLAVLDRRKNFLPLSASEQLGWLQTALWGTFTPARLPYFLAII